MIEKRLRDLWSNLQGKKPHLPHFLTEMRLDGIRGINGLRVVFDYPVSVIAGGNASGKSTVLFAAACAYKVPGTGVKDFVPSTLFPRYNPKLNGRADEDREIIIDFDYSTLDGRQSMRWRRSKGWNRSYHGRKNASQPERQIYLRTLSNLSNPSEVRGVLSMSRLSAPPEEIHLTAAQIEFAQRLLPFRYSEVVDLSSGRKNLLFASQEGGPAYSELHMAAGERAILRMSQEIAQLNGALILIDEVEAGLHPWVQQLLMAQFQQLALRNDLQIIVTTHSPVVLESVPVNGRIFLDRDENGRVTVQPPYRDLVQDALYGRTNDTLNLLCEDASAEGILDGILDYLSIKQRINRQSIRIGRDTGAKEFPQHASAFQKFGQIRNFAFVLDGDKRHTNISHRILDQAKTDVPVLFLPGNHAPEVWVWDLLRQASDETATVLGINSPSLARSVARLDDTYDSASDSTSEIAKSKLQGLSELLNRTVPEICRAVSYQESTRSESEIQPLVGDMESSLLRWRGE